MSLLTPSTPPLIALMIAISITLGGCDELLESEGPTTSCSRSYDAAITLEDFGIACSSDEECAQGECLMPGDDGNITNNVFGFCTRACDCDSASLSSTDPNYHCVYPGGCFVSESQGSWRYAAPKCGDVSDCQAIDERYTDCATTDRKTVIDQTCGSLTKVCQAHAN